jgi:hypothetical protein
MVASVIEVPVLFLQMFHPVEFRSLRCRIDLLLRTIQEGYRFVREGQVGRYYSTFEKAQIAMFMKRSKKAMEAYGYA